MSQASHNTLVRIDSGIKWWCGYKHPPPPRKNGCHHCHRIFDHKLLVSERVMALVVFIAEPYT